MHRFFLTLSRLFAYLGGLMLVALIFMTCASVLGRWANDMLHGMVGAGVMPGVAQWGLDAGIGAIRGDFELMEAGIAFAIFAFLPWCQITGGHAAVDLFTSRLPPRADRILRAITEGLFAAVLVVIAVQLGAGMVSKLQSGQTTFLLQVPLWWAYALSLSGAAAAAGVGLYMAAARLAEAWLGRPLLPQAAP
ncbi:Tripartite ATP-independent transporter, DctQ component [Pseudorhodobacter antarcticus]|jgi:TRAP-type C4-dicarboxylate transport system permease small subunit|uniref:TRAP transporter small permease protein n=1 Tax=Pseudorhodobacter antarcticus TaxID=1077947 RepID=A0A1H8EM34_9RHOB|nr:TRAP transporter small permease [Pseudorhodobacter antarcticus]SEN19848.1 Tripartite ATP-independent transporter, DctQ component [Pseudorhodobacter antarcticus]